MLLFPPDGVVRVPHHRRHPPSSRHCGRWQGQGLGVVAVVLGRMLTMRFDLGLRGLPTCAVEWGIIIPHDIFYDTPNCSTLLLGID